MADALAIPECLIAFRHPRVSVLYRLVAVVLVVLFGLVTALGPSLPAGAAESHAKKPAASAQAKKAQGGHGEGDGHGGGGHGGGGHGGHGGEEEAAPETFIVLDLLSEAAEASVAGIGVKIAELNPKIKHINELYKKGENGKANAKILGILTEVVLIGALIELTGVGELFLSAISFAGDWMWQLGQSSLGILAITKSAVVAGEAVEEAAEEKFAHAAQAAQATPARKRKP